MGNTVWSVRPLHPVVPLVAVGRRDHAGAGSASLNVEAQGTPFLHRSSRLVSASSGADKLLSHRRRVCLRCVTTRFFGRHAFSLCNLCMCMLGLHASKARWPRAGRHNCGSAISCRLLRHGLPCYLRYMPHACPSWRDGAALVTAGNRLPALPTAAEHDPPHPPDL
jgi:hypothetical protein